MDKLKIKYDPMAPKFVEPDYEKGDPEKFVKKLAKGKADSISEIFPDALVIGSDQMCAFGNELVSKPGGFEKAFEQLKKLQGNTHQLFTSLHINYQGSEYSALDITELKMRPLTDDEIESYLGKDSPFDCAGSYKIESLGALLFESVDTPDPNSIIGLPLARLSDGLYKLGFSPFA